MDQSQAKQRQPLKLLSLSEKPHENVWHVTDLNSAACGDAFHLNDCETLHSRPYKIYKPANTAFLGLSPMFEFHMRLLKSCITLRP